MHPESRPSEGPRGAVSVQLQDAVTDMLADSHPPLKQPSCPALHHGQKVTPGMDTTLSTIQLCFCLSRASPRPMLGELSEGVSGKLWRCMRRQ